MSQNRTALSSSVFALCVATASATGQTAGADSVELDIPYVLNGGHAQQLDLYTAAVSGFPTILFVHGGSLTSGDRKDEPHAEMCRTFQALGVGCAVTNYRLAPNHKWPAQPNDVAAAFAWLKRNIAARGGNPDRLFLFGHSSGCLLVAIVATDGRYLESQGLTQHDVAGVVPMGCRLNDRVQVTDTEPEAYESSWVPNDRVDDYMRSESAFVSIEQRNDAVPAEHVTAAQPPMLVLIADAERFFPPVLRDAAEFVGRSLTAGADVDIAILPNRTHMTAIQRMVTAEDAAVVKVMEFVRSRR